MTGVQTCALPICPSVTEEVLKRIPLDKLLSETDGPTALEWVNGVYGYPSEVKRVVNDISKLYKLI